MSILITGVAGFIGSHTAKEILKDKNANIVGIDNFNSYYNPEFKEENIKGLKIRIYRGDIRDAALLGKIFSENKIDKIIHLASMVGVRYSIENPEIYQDVNVRGTLNMLEMARKHKCRKFIFGSSSSVYGNNRKVPFSENDNVDNPISPYAATKKSAELLCYTYHYLYNLPVVCLRFFTVYGPNGRPDMAPYKFTEAISKGREIDVYGDGETRRDYTYVTDIVDGIIKSLGLDDGYEIINLGGSNPIELNKFIGIIEKNLGKKAEISRKPMQPGDVMQTYADISKAKRLLGYSPKVNIEEGMRLFCGWFVENRSKDWKKSH